MQCKLCGSCNIKKVKTGISPEDLSAEDFAITDKRYGTTLDIFLCQNCEFQFCPTAKDLLKLYQSMDDEEYTDSGTERKRQFQAIFKELIPHISPSYNKSLDIGCGSGLFVEIFADNGFDAYGVEPSKSLAKYCKAKNLKVTNGTIEDLPLDVKFDIITLVDVIEHVTDPKSLVKEAVKHLKINGILCILTPRVDSYARKVLGLNWWHYRIAHVGYFTKRNLTELLTDSGTDLIHSFSPSWFFSFENLMNRMIQYIPFVKFLKFRLLSNIIIRINLFDSIAVIAEKKNEP